MSKLTIFAASDKRQDKIRRARSVNDLVDLLNEISLEVHKNTKVISSIVRSLSSTSANKTGDVEINIDHTGRTPSPAKVELKAQPSITSLGVKLEKFVAPPLAGIKASVKALKALYDNALELDSIEALLSHTFLDKKARPRALAGVVSLKEEVNRSINTALGALNNVAKKHIPAEMQKLNTKLIGFVFDNVDHKTYKDLSEIVYVAAENSSQLQFSLYLCLHNLTVEEFTYTEFYIVLTGIVDTDVGTIRYYLNTIPDFKVPGAYEVGKPIQNEKEMVTRIRFLLAQNHVMVGLEKRVIPVTKDELKTKGILSIPYVADAEVADDSIYVYLKANTPPTKVNQVIIEIRPLLNLAVGLSGKSRSLFVSSVVTRRQRKALKFVLTPDIRSEEVQHLTINSERLKELQAALGLTTAETNAIRKALKGLL